MATNNEIIERRMVPRWRTFTEALETGELSASVVVSAPKLDVLPFLQEKERAWQENRTLPFAAELISASIVLGASSIAAEAAEFLLENGDQATTTAQNIAKQVLGIPDEVLARGSKPVTREEIRNSLGALKRRRVISPRSPFVWVDLARLYALMGQLNPARQAIRVALGLAPTERFVVRSATRFLLHAGQPDEALDLLRHCSRTPNDPWLLAAEIAVSNVAGKTPRFVKFGRSVLESKGSHAFHLSELATALGSLEMISGANKKANRLFECALESPTDNALAQIVWASSRTNLGEVRRELLSAPLAYEARAFHEQNHRRWEALIAFADEWANDESFSARPRLMASGTASSLLNNPSLGEKIARAGLEANPDHPGLINNLAFSLSLQGKTDEAFNILKLIDSSKCSVDESVCLLATVGLAHYRSGNSVEGATYYSKATELATKNHLDQLAIRAKLYFAYEQIRAGAKDGLTALGNGLDQARRTNQPQLLALADHFVNQVMGSIPAADVQVLRKVKEIRMIGRTAAIM